MYKKPEEEKREFEVGEIVQLKSGGPLMTIKEWCRVYKGWTCQWFEGQRLRDASFAENQLKRPPKDTGEIPST